MSDVLALRGAFPLKRETRFLTQLNRLDDATEYRSYEQVKRLCRWDFELHYLAPDQTAALEDFFQRTNGQYRPFAFLDPLENLLCWSEDFTQTKWESSEPVALRFDGQTADPLGGTGGQRLTNQSAAANEVTQWLEAPATGLELTASMWAKAASPLSLSLVLLSDTGESYQAAVALTPDWRRHVLTAQFAAGGASQRIGFRFRLPAQSTVELFGAQLMSLPAAGDYTKTTDLSGFHPRCRFASDVCATRCDAPGLAAAKVSIAEFL